MMAIEVETCNGKLFKNLNFKIVITDRKLAHKIVYICYTAYFLKKHICPS
jgi:hypothetical protein